MWFCGLTRQRVRGRDRFGRKHVILKQTIAHILLTVSIQIKYFQATTFATITVISYGEQHEVIC